MALPSLEQILKAHEEALERARKTAEITAHSPEMLPELLRNQKIERERLNRRIERLVAESDRIAAGFAAEINRQREALSRVDAELAKLEPEKPPRSRGGKGADG